jgi:hypothetical protein
MNWVTVILHDRDTCCPTTSQETLGQSPRTPLGANIILFAKQTVEHIAEDKVVEAYTVLMKL